MGCMIGFENQIEVSAHGQIKIKLIPGEKATQYLQLNMKSSE